MGDASYSHALARCQPVTADLVAIIRAPLTYLPGIGPNLAASLARLVGGPTLRHLLLHMPDSYVDRRQRPRLADGRPGGIVTLEVQVMRHDKPRSRAQPWRVVVTDGSAFADIVLFHQARLSQMPVGATLIVSGKLERFNDKLTLPHPDYVLPLDRAGEMPEIEPVWPLTAGVSNRLVGKAMAGALVRLPEFPEWIEPSLLARRRWIGFSAALRRVQAPDTDDRAREAARTRLAYDELLAEQIALGLRRLARHKRPGRRLTGDGHLRAEALRRFGFQPTGSQIRALAEIDADMASPRPMLRLLQGDVGSGKTLVALLAMLRAAEAGTQAALMAPTELLVQQHFRTLSALSPVTVGLLTGSVSPADRRGITRGLADGSVRLVVGTHALFQKSVEFRDLGLAVIDEQHRFGVEQRISLGDKGNATDVLVMTATPIPRSREGAGQCAPPSPSRRCPMWWRASRARSIGARASTGSVHSYLRARPRISQPPRIVSPSCRSVSETRSVSPMAGRTPGCGRLRWRISPPAGYGCWWRRRWWRSASMCRRRRSWSSNMPSDSGLPSSTSCAGGLAVGRRTVSASSCMRMASPPWRSRG
jgi:ATP-dependent DNA helicase RecG